MPTRIFVNLPVKDLTKTKTFFSALGYAFNPEYTDEKAACMIISDSIFAMLITRDFFRTFTKKKIADTGLTASSIVALTMENREAVDGMARKAVAAGGKVHREPEDLGWMYVQCIEDIDGHLWEFFWMDESKRPAHDTAL